MRILVTGSLGTLGRPLVEELVDRGHEVWGCDRRHSGRDYFIRADVGDYRQLTVAFEQSKPDVVYHLAAEFGRHNGEQFYEDLWQTGAIGTRNVLELCKVYSSRLLLASSSEIYGECEEDWLSEGLPMNQPMWQQNEYALSKWVNEVQVVNFQRRYGLDATRLRIFNTYGPGEHFHAFRSVVALFCHKALRNEPLPVFEGYHRTFMFIDDFIPTLANVCERELAQPVYNIGGADYRSVEELARIVLTEVKGLYLRVNGGPSDIDLIPEDRHNVRSKRPDITFAKADLDHDPKTLLEEGVPQTVDWMRETEPANWNFPNRNFRNCKAVASAG
jgi:dTDP-glucose 4,6-dehydratase